jgi:hypothetical protein
MQMLLPFQKFLMNLLFLMFRHLHPWFLMFRLNPKPHCFRACQLFQRFRLMHLFRLSLNLQKYHLYHLYSMFHLLPMWRMFRLSLYFQKMRLRHCYQQTPKYPKYLL